jgi:hypothetical protein
MALTEAGIKDLEHGLPTSGLLVGGNNDGEMRRRAIDPRRRLRGKLAQIGNECRHVLGVEGIARHQILKAIAAGRHSLAYGAGEARFVIGRSRQKGKLLMLHAFGMAPRLRPRLRVHE